MGRSGGACVQHLRAAHGVDQAWSAREAGGVWSCGAQVIERHEKLFGKKPKVLAGDKGFCPKAEKYAELAEQVETLAIPRRMRDFADKVLAVWQMFRAGIEGTMSYWPDRA
jgi:hypothetical protein